MPDNQTDQVIVAVAAATILAVMDCSKQSSGKIRLVHIVGMIVVERSIPVSTIVTVVRSRQQ